jgi:hypothetical protein
MTKAENRAAAKAWHEERQRQRAEEARAEAVHAALVALDRFRRYLLQSRLGHTQPLIEAIDDYVEQITGDRTALHAKSTSIGPAKRGPPA